MDRESLRRILAELVEQETGSRPENLGDDVILTQGLGIDSIDLVGLVVQVENRFGIKIDTDELRQITKVGEFLGMLESKIAAVNSEAAQA